MSSETPPDWREVRLGDLLKVEHGYAFKSAHFTEPGRDDPIVVGIGNFKYTGGFRFDDTAIKGYSVEYPERFDLTAGDIVLVMTCQTQGGEILGIPARVPDDGRTYLHNQRIGRVRFTSTDLDPDFAYWLFLTPEFNRELCRSATGSKILHTAPNRIESYAFRLPPIEEQRQIAAVLDALDEKIASNQRVARVLQRCIDALFEHEVPQNAASPGWTQTDLTALARFVNGRAFTKDANGVGRPILRIKELNGGLSETTLYSDLTADDDNIARHHDLLFSWSGSLDVYRWHGPESLINQHIFKVQCNDGIPVWFTAGWIRHHLPEFRAIAKDKATTMGHIKREHLRAAIVAIPPGERLAQLDVLMQPLDSQIGALAAETQTLVAIRSRLIQPLMSGRKRAVRTTELAMSAA